MGNPTGSYWDVIRTCVHCRCLGNFILVVRQGLEMDLRCDHFFYTYHQDLNILRSEWKTIPLIHSLIFFYITTFMSVFKLLNPNLWDSIVSVTKEKWNVELLQDVVPVSVVSLVYRPLLLCIGKGRWEGLRTDPEEQFSV